ncbi:MAG TPA: type II toxin-antitoxin system VapC family toxin [Candidatus Limnocylindrales bacterium]|jgi:predicted nucleic acid-binding protein
MAYIDSSALVKLVVEEAESGTMYRWWLEAERVTTSRIAVIETVRAAARRSHDPQHRDLVIDELEIIELDEAIAVRAAALQPPSLRTLDAIHVASALPLLSELDAFVTYDLRLAEAARALGLPVVSPA